MGNSALNTTIQAAASKQAVLLLVIIILMLLSYGCMKTPAEPAMPSWQTQISVPIVDRTYYFSELVAKDGKFETMVNGEVYYRPSDVKNTPTAIPLPAVYPIQASVSNTLGPVPLTLRALPEVDLSLTELLGQAPPQIPWSFGEISIAQNQSIVSDTAMFDYVTFDKARITITVTNSFNFDVIFPSGVKVMNVFSAADTMKELVLFPIGLLKAHTSQVLSADISGRTMASKLRLVFTIQTMGMNGTTLSTTGRVAASMVIDGGTVGSASTMKAAKVRVDGEYGQVTDAGFMRLIDDSTYIKRADFSSGSVDLKITNTVPIDLAAGIVIRELINKKTGRAFRLKSGGTGQEMDEVTIARNTTFTQVVDLSEYMFISQNFSGTDTIPTAGVQYLMTLRSLGATADKRLVTAGDQITATISPRRTGGVVQPISVRRFEGVIKPTTVSINETVETDFGDDLKNFSADSITFDNATIVLKLFTKTTYPADVDMRVTAWRKGVKGASMKVPSGNGGMNGAYRIVPGDTARIVFNKSTTSAGLTVDQFMNSFTANGKVQLPDKLVLEGTGTIGPTDLFRNGTNGYVGSVTSGDSLYSSLEFYFPVRIAVQNGIFRDTTEFANDVKADKLDLLETGKVIFQIENSFPVSSDLSLMLMGSRAQGDTLLNVTKTPLHIESALYNENGVNVPQKSYSFVTLAKGEASKFAGATIAAVRAHMQTGGGGKPVSFRTNDYIRVKAYGTFNVTVDFNKLSGDDNNAAK